MIQAARPNRRTPKDYVILSTTGQRNLRTARGSAGLHPLRRVSLSACPSTGRRAARLGSSIRANRAVINAARRVGETPTTPMSSLCEV